MDKDTLDALIGQLAADATFNQALVIALMELHPSLHSAIEAKVAAAAPGVVLGLPPQYQQSFRERLSDRLQQMHDAKLP